MLKRGNSYYGGLDSEMAWEFNNPYSPKSGTDPVVPRPVEFIQDLTICYITARRDPRIHWFIDSLVRQIKPTDEQIKIIIVTGEEIDVSNCASGNYVLRLVSPKPNVWFGKHRITRENWWAASAFRNTGLCYCDTNHIAYVDDASVLCPDWLNSVRSAIRRQGVTCGSYQKVRNLIVDRGRIVSYDEFPQGLDHRPKTRPPSPQTVWPCHGSWLYGCSCFFHTEDLLKVGGWPEFCDGSSAEDTSLGLMLENAGVTLCYDPWMKTLESDEHHVGTARREDKGRIGTPDSKSHAIVRRAASTSYFYNYYNGGMRALRERILSGEQFPVPTKPDCDWYDDQPLKEM